MLLTLAKAPPPQFPPSDRPGVDTGMNRCDLLRIAQLLRPQKLQSKHTFFFLTACPASLLAAHHPRTFPSSGQESDQYFILFIPHRAGEQNNFPYILENGSVASRFRPLPLPFRPTGFEARILTIHQIFFPFRSGATYHQSSNDVLVTFA